MALQVVDATSADPDNIQQNGSGDAASVYFRKLTPHYGPLYIRDSSEESMGEFRLGQFAK